MMSSSSELGEEQTIDVQERSRWNSKRILNSCSALVNDARRSSATCDRCSMRRGCAASRRCRVDAGSASGDRAHCVRSALALAPAAAHHRAIKIIFGGSASMSALSRRNFLALSGSAAAATLSGRLADAAMGPNDKFDLVIKGGDVLDPSQSLRGKRDIGIRWGAIEAIENEIPAARASKTIDATGKLVTPGLIDLHSPCLPLRLGDRDSRRRAGAVSVHDHDGLGRRCRRQQSRGAAALHRGAVAHAHLCLRPHRQQRPVGVPGRRALQHRQRADGSLRHGAGGKPGFPARRQGADVGECHLQARPRAAEARHPGLRAVRLAGQDDGAYRRRRDQGADVGDPRT